MVTVLLSSMIAVGRRLDMKDREEVTQDMIGNILRMMMVCLVSIVLSETSHMIVLLIQLFIYRKEMRSLIEKECKR